MDQLKNLAYWIREAVAPAPIQVAKREIGVKEIRGGENPQILKYFRATTLKATEDEVPWCSAFMNWIMRECHMERSGSAAARSWLGVGTRLPGFRKYSIVVFRRGNSSWQGHVALAMEDLGGGYIRCLGGNQSDAVKYSNYAVGSVLGYRWPQSEVENEVHPQA
jgi:uncharacterized protein (TIGR02594 family)